MKIQLLLIVPAVLLLKEMKKMFGKRKAQAVLELAILGSLIIMAFSILISYSEKYNREQSYMQQTFRAALKKAQEINNSASWTTTDFRRMPNVTNPMEIGTLQQFGSGNSVLWSDGKKKGKEETEPEAYFELNRIKVVKILASEGPGAQEGDITISNSSYTSSLNSPAQFIKKESGGNISTQKTLKATDNISGSADISGRKVSLDSSLGEGGKYTGGGLSRGTSMQ